MPLYGERGYIDTVDNVYKTTYFTNTQLKIWPLENRLMPKMVPP